MKWIIKDMDGDIETKGEGEEALAAEAGHAQKVIPTHGSVSVQLPNGEWLNFLCSEWMTISVSKEPEGWK